MCELFKKKKDKSNFHESKSREFIQRQLSYDYPIVYLDEEFFFF